jgi:CRP-like cAMP-binding protein
MGASEDGPILSANRLLAALPPRDYEEMLPDLLTVSFSEKHVLLDPAVPPSHVYCPCGAVCSLTVLTSDGDMAGVAIVGHEGLIGLSGFSGDSDSNEAAAVVIAEGDLQAIDLAAFRREMEHRPPFRRLVNGYIQAFAESLMQSAACNVLHSVEPRLARCLLELRDRLGRDELPVTQETLAVMLGVRRPSVTLATDSLWRMGLIEHGHKRIVIRDPSGLASACCECYEIVKGTLRARA